MTDLNLNVDAVESVFEAVEDKGGFFQLPVGKYKGLMGRLVPKYKNANGDKCEKGEPGAVLSYAMQEIFVMQNLTTGEQYITNELTFSDDAPFGAFKTTKYIDIKNSNQYFNKLFYADFYVEGDTDKKYSVVKDSVLNFPMVGIVYVGCPVTFEIVEGTKKPGTYFINEMSLTSHVFSKELIDKRNEVIKRIEGNWWALKEKLDEEKVTKTVAEESVPEIQNPDDILGELTGM